MRGFLAHLDQRPTIGEYWPSEPHVASMHLPLSRFVLALSGALLAAAAGTRVEFASRVVEGAALRGVKDSGVCETTPGVGQMSGYLDVGKNMSMVSLFCLPWEAAGGALGGG